MEWIKCSDKLPDKDGEYLVYISDRVWSGAMILWFTNDFSQLDGDLYYPHKGFYESDPEYGYMEYKEVAHWMLLPEPPED